MKMNNKGFSLVELIVVIAIMAILVGVLAPSVTGQVDKSRKSKDDQNLDGLASAMATAITDELVKSNGTITPGVSATFTASGTSSVVSALSGTFSESWFATTAASQYLGGKDFKIESSAYKNASFTVTVDSNFRVTIVSSGATGDELSIQK